MADDRRQPLQSASACGGSERRQSGHEPHKRGLNTKIHLAVDAHGMPLRVVITQGTTADCTQAGRLIEGITAEHLIADKGYDSDAIVDQAKGQGMKAVIPPQQETAPPKGLTTKTCTNCAIWLKTRSCTSSAGAASPPDTPNMPPLSSPPSKSGASLFGRTIS